MKLSNKERGAWGELRVDHGGSINRSLADGTRTRGPQEVGVMYGAG